MKKNILVAYSSYSGTTRKIFAKRIPGLTGKTIIPFATSGSSSIQNSVKELKEQYNKINWHTGKLFNDGIAGVKEWAEEVIVAQ